jgi:hypothetical protein
LGGTSDVSNLFSHGSIPSITLQKLNLNEEIMINRSSQLDDYGKLLTTPSSAFISGESVKRKREEQNDGKEDDLEEEKNNEKNDGDEKSKIENLEKKRKNVQFSSERIFKRKRLNSVIAVGAVAQSPSMLLSEDEEEEIENSEKKGENNNGIDEVTEFEIENKVCDKKVDEEMFNEVKNISQETDVKIESNNKLLPQSPFNKQNFTSPHPVGLRKRNIPLLLPQAFLNANESISPRIPVASPKSSSTHQKKVLSLNPKKGEE